MLVIEFFREVRMKERKKCAHQRRKLERENLHHELISWRSRAKVEN